MASSIAPNAISSCTRRLAPCTRTPRALRPVVLAAFKLTDKQGRIASYDKPQCTVGSSSSCDLVINDPQVAPQHALLLQKGKQTFCKPLLGDSLLDESRCWLDGQPLRPGVSYVLGSGSSLAFGSQEAVFKIEFEEGAGGNPLLEMMMKGMVSGSSAEVKKALGGL